MSGSEMAQAETPLKFSSVAVKHTQLALISSISTASAPAVAVLFRMLWIISQSSLGFSINFQLAPRSPRPNSCTLSQSSPNCSVYR
jgi:hypothetical protein